MFSCLCASAVVVGCRRATESPRLLPEVSGTLEVDGLSAPVRIVRDRWGVPHVYADVRDDLFFGQGFVQAEDRLFQMDLWRRAAQGRLSEVLGANFIERDAMTRRLQYHDDVDRDWAQYGSDAKAMAQAFVAGINAWTAIARDQTPELFRLAGWKPSYWTAADLLNRTDAFDRDGTIAAAEQQGLPPTVVNAVRRAAVPPFFIALASPVVQSPDANVRPDVPADAERLPSPSPLYVIHLHSPNWNAVGATPPWRSGLTVGHDASATWERDEPKWTAAVRVAPFNPSAGRVVKDTIVVKGRNEPFAFVTQITETGVVIATDREGGRQFVLDWRGFEAGTAPAFARLSAAGQEGQAGREAEKRSAVFVHPLAITPAARARLNIGPLQPPATGDRPFHMTFDRAVWDASRAINPPGQSEWPASEHYSDLAQLWAAGRTFPLVYTDGGVNANAQATLTLVPRRHR